MLDLGQLYGALVDKAKKYSPIASDTKRKKAYERSGEMFGMEQGIVGVSA